ncbi:MAG: sterol desaturase family protein [Chloroherpetonaceae bacterium]|nr:sterol desaturase family protein [Chloroherpetonaceae bacterium]
MIGLSPKTMTLPSTIYIMFVFGILSIDVMMYFLHRYYHHNQFLWRFHKLHHEESSMNLTSTFRFHWVEIVFSYGLRSLLFAVFPIPPATWLIYDLLSLTVILFHHANISLNPFVNKFLSVLIVTPPMHQVHHSRNHHESLHNFSSFLSFWDKIFGTYLKKDGDFSLGIEGESTQTNVVLFWISPFKR